MISWGILKNGLLAESRPSCLDWEFLCVVWAVMREEGHLPNSFWLTGFHLCLIWETLFLQDAIITKDLTWFLNTVLSPIHACACQYIMLFSSWKLMNISWICGWRFFSLLCIILFLTIAIPLRKLLNSETKYTFSYDWQASRK